MDVVTTKLKTGKGRWVAVVAAATLQLGCGERPDEASTATELGSFPRLHESVDSTPPVLLRIDDAPSLTSAIANFGPADVRKHLIEMEPGAWRKWMPVFYREWGVLDGEAAMKAALSEENELVSKAAGAVLRAWVTTDIGAAQQWVESGPKGRAQMQFASIVMNEIESPRDAAAWLAHLNPDNVSNLSDVVSRISQKWIKTEPMAALAWLDSMPVDQMRESATVHTFFHWAKGDPESASTFLSQLDPSQPFYSLAAEGLARAVSVTDAEAALAWAEEVKPSQRELSGLDNTILHGAQAILESPDSADTEPVSSAPSPLGM